MSYGVNGSKLFLHQNFMNIDAMTLILFFLSPWLVEGPQKPQTLTASKTKYEKFGSNIWIKYLNSSLKNRYFGALIFFEREFFDL